jgi:uncharacterized protein
MEETATRPSPDPRGAGKQYWASAHAGTLTLPRCLSCETAHWYPRLYCPNCGSDKLEWITCSGKGVIHTYTIVRQSGHKYFKSKVPYVLAMVALDEGVLMMSNIIECDVDTVRVDARVSVVFEKLGDDVGVPLFKLAEGAK